MSAGIRNLFHLTRSSQLHTQVKTLLLLLAINHVFAARRCCIARMLRVQSTPVPPLSCYGAEAWTLSVADVNTLEAFHIRCQRQIHDIRWWAHDSDAEVLRRSGLSTILVTSYVIDAYLWPCCTPGPWSTSTRCSAFDGGYTYESRKAVARWRRSPDRPHNV